ncbi:MAG: hypothetical protein ACTS9Y_00400 [Methylophilus sp.]|uniref:hypothetical protein n=1 Tax=Methylophilus sp. TaxID=29541 RepID=UPI003FA05D18
MQIKCFIDDDGSIWTFNQATGKWNHPMEIEVDELTKQVHVLTDEGTVGKSTAATYSLFESLGALSVVIEQHSSTNRMNPAPLTGRWHHGNETLVCGTLRICNLDVDTNPGPEFKKSILDWVCNSLNQTVSNELAAGLHKLEAVA